MLHCGMHFCRQLLFLRFRRKVGARPGAQLKARENSSQEREEYSSHKNGAGIEATIFPSRKGIGNSFQRKPFLTPVRKKRLRLAFLIAARKRSHSRLQRP